MNKKQLDPSLVNMVPPKFSWSLLQPKYWSVWFGFGLMALVVNLLPYRVLRAIGQALGKRSMRIAQKRVAIANRNLELCFPEMTAGKRQQIVEENFKNTGFAIFESAIAWFWPDWRLKKHTNFHDLEPLLALETQGKGVLCCGVHALNVELTARCCSLFSPGYGVYRPHENPAYNFVQHWGRTRSGNVMVDRKDVKGMLRVLKKGYKLFYLPDHDYGTRKTEFAPFFAMEHASTTVGTSILVDGSGCALMTVSCFRNDCHYEFIVDDDISADFPHKDPKAATAFMNKHVEKVILRGLDQWMWLHKRFKTQPDQPKGILYK